MRRRLGNRIGGCGVGLAFPRAFLKRGRRRRKGGVAVLKKYRMEPVETQVYSDKLDMVMHPHGAWRSGVVGPQRQQLQQQNPRGPQRFSGA